MSHVEDTCTKGRADLTNRQRDFLTTFHALVDRTSGISPTLKELAEEMGVCQATVRYFVRRMVAKGYLTGEKGKFRTLRAI